MESVKVDIFVCSELTPEHPLSNVVNSHYNYLLFVSFQTPIDFIRLRFRFVKETVKL